MLFARLADSPNYQHRFSERRDSKVIYLGESYNLSYVMRHLFALYDQAGEEEHRPRQLHFFVPENMDARARNVPRDESFEKEEMESLQRKGALMLPPRDTSDELIRTFFRWTFTSSTEEHSYRSMRMGRSPCLSYRRYPLPLQHTATLQPFES